VAARLGDRRGDGLQLAAVDPDREGREVVLRVQAIGVGERVEEDRLVVDERGATGEKVWRSTGPRRWRCAAGGEAGHRALASREIEDYDLDGLLASGPRPEIRESDSTTVRAEGYRRGEGEDIPLRQECRDGALPDAEARVAARGAEVAPFTTIGADEEEPFLLGR